MPVRSGLRGSFAGLALFLLLTAPAYADLMEGCAGPDVAMKISACSALIKAGKLPDGPMALAYNHRGMALVISGDQELAIEDFGEAIRLDPKFTDAYSNRGHAHLFLAQFDAALRDFNQAIKLDPNADAYTARATVHILTGALKLAHDDLTEAVLLDPKNIHSLANRAMVNRMMGNIFAAIADYNAVLKLDPDDEDAKRNLKELLNDPAAGASASLIAAPPAPKIKLPVGPASNRLNLVWIR